MLARETTGAMFKCFPAHSFLPQQPNCFHQSILLLTADQQGVKLMRGRSAGEGNAFPVQFCHHTMTVWCRSRLRRHLNASLVHFWITWLWWHNGSGLRNASWAVNKAAWSTGGWFVLQSVWVRRAQTISFWSMNWSNLSLTLLLIVLHAHPK